MADSTDGKHGTSDEFIDPYCDICYVVKNLNVRPEGYCHDCFQCLCKDCLVVHTRLLGTRGHVIRTGEDMPKSHADKPPRFEYCDVHHCHQRDQYCSEHMELLCMLCVPLHHKGCLVEKVECAAKGIPSSELDVLYETVSDFKTQLLSAESHMKGIARDLIGQRNKILKEIQEIYDKTKSKIDKLFQDIKSDLESKYQRQVSVLAHDKTNIKDAIVTLYSTLDDITALKVNTLDTKAFLKIQDILKGIDKCRTDMSTINQTRSMLNFVPGQTMKKFLSSTFTMGTILLEDSNHDVTISVPEIKFPVSPIKPSQAAAAGYQSPGITKPVSNTMAQKYLKSKIKLPDDTNDCWITGMVITPDGRRLLVDCWNNKIKMFSRGMKIISSLSLPATPWGIAIAGDMEAVVSVVGDSTFFILDVTDKKMSIRRTLQLPFGVVGVATYREKLVTTVLSSPRSVKLIDQSCKVYWSTVADQQGQKLFSYPAHVTCYDDGRSSNVIVSDWSNHTLTMLNINTGDVTRRRQVEGKGPWGVTTDTAGNIYVCYQGTGEVAVLSTDFSEEKILLTQRDGINGRLAAIIYDAKDHQLLVSCYKDDGCNDVDCFQLI